ncbi:PRD domain-containing protein [Streptococcus gallinaceus]|uniref:Transcriptional antiterminator n=1 Tax=Streptococcus gallinaceus TaxID=165758 RepID=A0ABV2JPJ5_9STRE
MKVVQSLNQNALLVLDRNGNEIVALGKGIGFNKKKGDIVSEANISRIFTVQSNEQEKGLLENLKSVASEVYLMAEDVVHFAEKELHKTLNESFIFTIAKHIEFALERNDEGIEYDPFQYQLNYLYPDEYRTAKEIIPFLNEKYHLQLKRQEVSFFTLHFVNGLIDSEQVSDVVQLSELLNRVLLLIDRQIGGGLEKDSLAYSRFVIHLRYFLVRMLSKKKGEPTEDQRIEELLNLTKEMYAKEYEILQSLKELLQKEYQISFGIDEDLYLLLHLVRICRKEKG